MAEERFGEEIGGWENVSSWWPVVIIVSGRYELRWGVVTCGCHVWWGG